MKKQMFDTIDSKILRSFEIVKKVGQGAYGQVWKAKNKKSGSICALKKIYEAFRNSTDAQKAYRQIKYLQKIDHPNIIKLLSYHKPTNSKDIYLQLQFMEADLSVALKNSVLKEIHKHYIFYQMINALCYLHSADLVHRDIKPSNILVNQTCEVKLCDFGLIRSLKKDNIAQELVMTENVATRWYRAPQILLSTNNYGKAVDVWSLGCVLAEMILQRPIFQGNSTISQLQKIFEITGKPSKQDLYFLKNEASLKIIQNMQVPQRKSFKQIFINQDKVLFDLLQKIFQINPSKRSTAQEVMKHPFVSRFRGRVQQKLPKQLIKILYDHDPLQVEVYRSLLYGQIDEKDLFNDTKNKSHEESTFCESSIYKTVPNRACRNNFFGGGLEKNDKKSPMHTSNLKQKSLSPLFVKIRQNNLILQSNQQKKDRHSPSFLQMRKKQSSPTKVTPQKSPTGNDNASVKNNFACQIKKMMTFPQRISPKHQYSPPKQLSPYRFKYETGKQQHCDFPLKNQKSNPECPSQTPVIKHYTSSILTSAGQSNPRPINLNTKLIVDSKIKQKPGQKYVFEFQRKGLTANRIQNKSQQKKDGLSPFKQKTPNKAYSPFSRTPAPQVGLSFKTPTNVVNSPSGSFKPQFQYVSSYMQVRK